MPKDEEQYSVNVTIAGERFSLHGHVDTNHMAMLARLVDEKMTEIRKRLPTTTYLRCALLVALNLMDEIQIAHKEAQHIPEMLERLDRSLDELLQALLQE